MKIYLIAFLLSLVLAVIFGFTLLPILRKIKINQPILKYVKEHSSKSGTPTMGGLFFIISAIISFFAFSKDNNKLSIITILIVVGFMIIGFLDDFLKIKLKENKGLSVFQKLVFIICVSIIASIIAYDSGLNFLYLPFTNCKLSLGYFTIILNVLVFVATVNSVNLTDGLDGLCSSVSVVFFIAIAILISLEISFDRSKYIIESEYYNLSLLSISLVGGLLGYLVFNTSKASVFMGDTGSLSLGGGIATISILSGNTLYIPIIGVTYLLSSLSVIIQVLYFKRTKKRVFLMAPIHHHFQQKGFSESKITFVYTLITIVCGVLSIFSYL